MAKYILKAFFLTTFPSTQKKCPKIYAVTLVLPLKTEKKTWRNKLTLSSGSLMFRLKQKFHFFVIFSTNSKMIVLRLKEIRHCLIVARGSLKTLAFLNIKCKKYKNLETKCGTTSPGLPYFVYLLEFFIQLLDHFSPLLLCKINVPENFHTTDFFSDFDSIVKYSKFSLNLLK